jgi:hypothetical protein
MCELVSELKNVEGMTILPYHGLGVDKARRLGKEARFHAKPSDRLLNQSMRLIRSYGLAVSVGG